MEQTMSPAAAIKAFVEKGSRPVTLSEMKEFLSSITSEQKKQYAEEAAKHLGVKLTQVGL